ncbi:6-pyruvoyl trahydropterin synthase family protein [Natronobacterium gregoryi]|uniref:6-carboxy-5,6,7,8-tetrahydropterin synthase n=2 Tax=Natronobacterium gregoryi TaxID=44930 RepID=L0AD76_NATGS|nr:6-pyruvoyl tetrahydropterin synthase family protein [Natronobacterium gregoryi]AFZ71858.1 6-pyruvoyl-tetrahydropterin synthase [Natronobacterium gregoryi SP2]ELY73072.1 6-pyruvoyl-tetrahydropterin synthase [Natronobacterium gregoryi SP2]PLK19375.1 6-carboxy-5,6,7,8-tetrahydropterin synthase [Natronobacterium gregoryi SP2]SFJ50447.1 6-pyruvoyltetrahydropterin/6-carboxytetrahydropterin synthase [Natronobacterium gregoryi]
MPERTGSLEEAPTDDGVVGTRRTLTVGHDRPIRISAGHRLLHHDGKCSRPHGHNYEITVTIDGALTEEGWVADKGDVTGVVQEWDHMFLVEDGDPLIEAFEAAGDDDALVVLEQPPTAEVMSVLLEKKLFDALPEMVTDIAVRVDETSELCGGRF